MFPFLTDRAFHVDAQTQRDLDLFPEDDSAGSIFDLLDHTRTRGGRARLRALLARPRCALEEIRAAQSALTWLSRAERRERFDPRASDRRLLSVEDYLDSYIAPLFGTVTPIFLVRAAWYKTSYRKYYETLAAGLRNLHRFLLNLRRFAERSSDDDLPEWLDGYRRACAQVLEDERIVRFLRAGGSTSRFWFWQVYRFDALLRRELREDLIRIVRLVYEIDALRALGIAVEAHGFRFPELVEDPPDGGFSIEAEDLFHPLLRDPQANDVELGRGRNFLFLTGPNMAGKTTYMKSLGVAAYLAHIGMAVPARSFRMTRLDGIASSLNVNDNLTAGYSFFYAEVRRVKTVAEALRRDRRLLVLFDELFKGTNVKDALDGSRMVVEGFERWEDSCFVLSSHLIELAEEIEGHPPVVFRCFESEVVDGKPHFSYRLRDGISTDRLGLLILRNEGVPDLLERDGRARSGDAGSGERDQPRGETRSTGPGGETRSPGPG